MKKNKKMRLPVLVLIGIFLADIFYIARYGRNLWNSDVASEMILGRLLNQTGGLLSDQWYYSTEIHVVGVELYYKPAMALFPDDWHAAQIFAAAAGQLGLIAAGLYVTWAGYLGARGIWWIAAMICPVSRWYAWNVLFNFPYLPYVTANLFAFGILLQSLHQPGKYRFLLYLLGVALSFACGMNGVRMMMIFYAPVLLGLMWLLLRKMRVERKSLSRTLQDYPELKRLAGMTVLLFFSNGFGMIVNKKVLATLYSFKSFGDMTWNDLSFSNMLTALGQLFGLFGWHSGDPVLSLAGIASLISLFAAAAMTVVVFRRARQLDTADTTYSFMFFSILQMVLLCLVAYGNITYYNASYWTTHLPFLFLLFMASLPKKFPKPFKPAVFRSAFLIYFLCCSLATYKNPYMPGVPDSRKLQNAAAWLVENGYTQGFGRFWDANVLTALSDGKIEVWSVQDLNTLSLSSGWLRPKSQDTERPEGKFFIITEYANFAGDDSNWVLLNNGLYEGKYVSYYDEQNGIYVLTFGSMQEYYSLVQSFS